MVILAIPMAFGAYWAGLSAILAVLMASWFYMIGWFDPGTSTVSGAVIIAIAGFTAVFHKLTEREQGGIR